MKSRRTASQKNRAQSYQNPAKPPFSALLQTLKKMAVCQQTRPHQRGQPNPRALPGSRAYRPKTTSKPAAN